MGVVQKKVCVSRENTANSKFTLAISSGKMQVLTENLHLICFLVGVTFSVVSFLPALAFLTCCANTLDSSWGDFTLRTLDYISIDWQTILIKLTGVPTLEHMDYKSSTQIHI